VKLEKGQTYYMLTYADANMTMPGVQPMIYIGKNAFYRVAGEESDTYQFQDTVSYKRLGFVMEAKQKEECLVVPFRKQQLGTDILTLEQTHKALGRALKRSRSLKGPRLTVSKGKWVTAKVETWVEKGPGAKNAR
jgi:hypothetical protein